ncbi:MAG: LysR family transcriptional regulator [Burkholderiales bacterium]|jgi:LysR family glycine cleavage system transcriptional activator|nr:LysR family transcriptional regulator [Burkholderiales bacterium]HJQ63224.1 transcriptional regulator GcvA [Burkholderiales bacterium]
MRLPPLNALKAFEAAARHLSVKRAAAELNVTPAAVSHQIRTLEEYLGVQLFHRYNRALELTDAARACLPKLREGFDCLIKAVEVLRAQKGTGAFTVSAAPSFAARWLMPRLHRFFEAHPEVDVRVSARMRQVSEGGKGTVAERATIDAWLADSDIAILYGRGDYPSFHVDKLLPLTVTPICSPRLITGQSPLTHPEDLRHHMLLHDDTGDLYDGESFWEVWLKAAGVNGVDTQRGPHFSHAVLAFEAAIEGTGVLATMPVLAAGDLHAARLITPFPLRVPIQSAYYLVCTDTAMTRPAVSAFREWLLSEAAREEEI